MWSFGWGYYSCVTRLLLYQENLVQACNQYTFFHFSLREWLVANLYNKWKIVSNVLWECIFDVAMWRLWYWRNHFLFDGELVHNTKIYLDIMARAYAIQRVNNSNISQQPRRKEMFIGRSPPLWPWCKLNTDGSCKNTGDAWAGGVLRDSFSYWVSGFCMKIGESSVTMAELWGLYQGLNLAWNVGIRRLLVEVDSRCVAQMTAK